MSDLYGSSDVTIRSDDGTQVVTISPDGAKQRLDVSASVVTPGAVNVNTTFQGTNAPYKSNMWLPVATYTVPDGYDLYPFQVQYSAGNSTSLIRVGDNMMMGSLNTTTNVFTDGNAYTAPRYSSYIELRLTEDVGSNRTITVTYVNELGTTGRTTTMTLIGPGGQQDKNGYTYIFTLQSPDVGVRDITNISTNSTGTGNFQIVGINEIIRDSADAANVIYTDALQLGVYEIKSGGTLGLSVTSASTSSVARYLQVFSQLGVS
jgi:hypothetical protein